MNRREDLLELTPQALTALANAGFVKRAQREVAAGQLPTLTIDDQGVVTAVFDDGVETRFAPGVGLADAQCNCPASGMCRHRVMLVLAWQAGVHGQGAGNTNVADTGAEQAGSTQATDFAPQPSPLNAGSDPGDESGSMETLPSTEKRQQVDTAHVSYATPTNQRPDGAFSPADFDDAQLTTALGATALAQAARFAQQRPTIRVLPWQAADAPPLARLPMCTVRFFSRHNLQLARCDCVAGGRCAHVALAVWAFRQAQPAPGEGERVLTLRGPVPFGAPHDGGSDASVPVATVCGDISAPAPTLSASAKKSRVSKATVDASNGEAEYSVIDIQGDGFGLQSEAGQRACQALDALLTQLWLDGATQPQLALAGRITGLRADLQTLGWQWLLDALAELEAQLHALAARSTRFEPTRLLDVSAELWARWRCARHQWQRESAGQASHSAAVHEALPAAEVLGRGVRGEVALDHLRLVSLGGSLWSDPHAEGASIFLADPDTQTVLVLEREWPKAEATPATTGSGPTPIPAPGQQQAGQAVQTSLLQRRVVNVPLRQLLDSQVVTKAAKRRANGVVDIGGNKRQTGVLPLSASAWNELSPPLAQPGVRALGRHLRQQIPPFAAPRHAASGAAAGVSGSLHVVRLAGQPLADWWWDSAAQTVHALWHEAALVTADDVDDAGNVPADLDDADGPIGDGATLHVQLSHQAEAPGAVDALARALAGEWGEVLAIAGPAWRAHGEVRMQATAIVCAQRALALAAQPVAPRDMPALEDGHGDDLRDLAIRGALNHLATLLRDGMRHQGGLWPQTVAEHAGLLRRAGFAQAAQAMADLPGLALGAQRDALLPQVSRLGLLLRELQAA